MPRPFKAAREAVGVDPGDGDEPAGRGPDVCAARRRRQINVAVQGVIGAKIQRHKLKLVACVDLGRILREKHRPGSAGCAIRVVEGPVEIDHYPASPPRRGSKVPAAEVGRVEELRRRQARPARARRLARRLGVPVGASDRSVVPTHQAAHIVVPADASRGVGVRNAPVVPTHQAAQTVVPADASRGVGVEDGRITIGHAHQAAHIVVPADASRGVGVGDGRIIMGPAHQAAHIRIARHPSRRHGVLNGGVRTRADQATDIVYRRGHRA